MTAEERARKEAETYALARLVAGVFIQMIKRGGVEVAPVTREWAMELDAMFDAEVTRDA